MTTFAASDWAYVVVGIALPVSTVFVAWITLRARIESLHNEVRSPNGTRTGEVTYENRKTLIDLREQMAEIREAQLVGWENARKDNLHAEESQRRVEATVDHIALAQDEHLERDDARFTALFTVVGVQDPTVTP